MTYAPAIPIGGLTGWRFLERTAAAQREVFARSPQIQREIEYFRANIDKVSNPGELVSDRNLLKVALGAFGLEEDLGKKFFIQKILSEGVELPNALANKLVDPRYRNITSAFGFGDLAPPDLSGGEFADSIGARYVELQFERAIGEADDSMRVALNFKREIAGLALSEDSEITGWFKVMGNPPLRLFFETALGLPAAIGALDVDRQAQIFRDKSRKIFGSSSLAVMQDSRKVDDAIRLYFVRNAGDLAANSTTPGYAAAAILLSGTATRQNSLLSLV